MPRRQRLEVGQVIKGTVVSVGSSHVFVDVGTKSEASLDRKEVTDETGAVQLKVGDTVEAYVVAHEPEVVLSYALARSHLNVAQLQDAHDLGIPVEGRVTGVNKGGLEVDFNGARAFCPISHVDVVYCEDATVHVGRVYPFRVMEFADDGRKIVVSRRALLEEERREAAESIQAQLHEGAEFEGEVKTLQPYGAFVELGAGVQGMIHISEIAHGHIDHPQDVLRVGQRVRVKVTRIERDAKHPDRQRIALSMRALLGNPWDQAASSLREGAEVEGKVVRLQPFGAFVEIVPGVDGLIHISEMTDRRISHPSEAVEVGQSVKVTVLKVDATARRISLSLRGRDAAASEELAVGSVVTAVVDQVKPFGLLARIKGAGRNARGLIPAEETGTGRNANLRRSFPEGTELKVMVTAVEPDTGRIRLSLKAVDEQDERDDYSKFVGNAPDRPAVTESNAPTSLGTLGDLLKNAASKTKGNRRHPR
jgi:small subunit ribosomal protein S1